MTVEEFKNSRNETKGQNEKGIEDRGKENRRTRQKEVSRLCGNGRETHECIWEFTNLEKGFTYVLVHHRNDYCRDGSSCALFTPTFLSLALFHSVVLSIYEKH